MKTLAKVVFAIAIAALALPAFAQDTIGTLTIVDGSAMTSTGGAYGNVSSGEPIQAGETLQLKTGDLVYIKYSNGVTVQYNGPGTFNLQMPAADSTVYRSGGAAGTSTGMSAAASAGIIIGTAVIAAALVNEMGDVVDPDNPLSR